MEFPPDALLGDLFSRSPDLLFIASAEGALLHPSGGLREALGPGVDGGARLADLAHPDDRAALDAAWSALLLGDEPVSFGVRLRDGGGAYRRLSCSASRSSDGSAVLGTLRAAPEIAGEALATIRLKARILDAVAEHMDPVAFWSVNLEGVCLYNAGKASERAGFKPGQLVGLNFADLYADESQRLGVSPEACFDGTVRRFPSQTNGIDWDNWLIPLRDDSGERVEGLIGLLLDVTESRHVENELRLQLDQIAAQQKVIRDLSTPIIEVWDGVLTLPMVGTVDSVRTAEVMDSLLAQIVEKRARFAILDLTGVEVVDTRVASHLIQLVTAIRLLGADGIVAGIKPNVAQTMVALGLDLTELNTQRNLRAALHYAIRSMSRAEGASPAPSPAPLKAPAP
ncbi:STAS domain-containing protein [Sorangium sp. So ce315]|uniref:STAS domain-containing protein n=1 Tax=Sorangium sp. So ce315 TaxID=3133299 RepID=UPI003F5DE162